ncbi:MAG: hypothetical protein JWR60_2754 [Polaromonas sp.]|nr:hypothetical protein [Polaromonas sp.]
MKFALKSLNGLVLAGLLATAGASAMAQDAAAIPPPAAGAAATAKPPAGHGPRQQMGDHKSGDHKMGQHRMGHRDPARMQAMMAKRQAELKARLKITPAQEPAWTSFTAAMQPPARMMGQHATPEQRAEMGKLTTPERIDKMRAMRTQHMAEMTAAMDKRGEATKTFYAALSPEQQKTFDAEHQRMGREMGKGGHHQRHPGGMAPKG